MGMIVDTSVGPAIFIVVGFVLKYISSVTISCNFCSVQPESRLRAVLSFFCSPSSFRASRGFAAPARVHCSH